MGGSGNVRGPKALQLILENQEPFPAVVTDRHWNTVKTNRAAPKFFGLFVDLSSNIGQGNVLKMMLHPEGIRPFIANWEIVVQSLIQRVFREAVGGFADHGTKALLEEIFSYRGVPRHWQSRVLETAALPIVPVEFRKDDLKFSFFSTITSLGTPQDISLQEIRIECFFPLTRTQKAPPVDYWLIERSRRPAELLLISRGGA
jgi:hypothetical protein